MTLVVNLIGGPGVGKSTIAASLFAKLKWMGINCEIVTEYAKDKVWEGSTDVLSDQPYLLGKQHHRQHVLRGKVDAIITDSPLFLSLIYGEHWGDTFSKYTLELFHSFNNVTYLIRRNKEYNPVGRTQTLQEAEEIDRQIRYKLTQYKIPYEEFPGGPEGELWIMNDLKFRLLDELVVEANRQE